MARRHSYGVARLVQSASPQRFGDGAGNQTHWRRWLLAYRLNDQQQNVSKDETEVRSVFLTMVTASKAPLAATTWPCQRSFNRRCSRG